MIQRSYLEAIFKKFELAIQSYESDTKSGFRQSKLLESFKLMLIYDYEVKGFSDYCTFIEYTNAVLFGASEIFDTKNTYEVTSVLSQISETYNAYKYILNKK